MKATRGPQIRCELAIGADDQPHDSACGPLKNHAAWREFDFSNPPSRERQRISVSLGNSFSWVAARRFTFFVGGGRTSTSLPRPWFGLSV